METFRSDISLGDNGGIGRRVKYRRGGRVSGEDLFNSFDKNATVDRSDRIGFLKLFHDEHAHFELVKPDPLGKRVTGFALEQMRLHGWDKKGWPFGEEQVSSGNYQSFGYSRHGPCKVKELFLDERLQDLISSGGGGVSP